MTATALLFMDAGERFIPLHDAAERLGVSVKLVLEGLEDWRRHDYREGHTYPIPEGSGSLLFRPVDADGVGEVLRLRGGGRVCRRLRFSLEVALD